MTLTKSKKKDRILVVDDVYDNLLVVEAILEDEGYEIILEENSRTALAKALESPPDLLLLDVMMPNIDGYEFTRRIRENTSLPFIPILLITANDQSNVVQGLDAGADDFIRKPVDPDELQARVRSLLRLKHSIDERDQMAISRFTHDLRIPLVASNRILKMMREGKFFQVSSELQDIFDNMISSNQDLLQMVNTMLEVYRYEANCKTFSFAPCNIQDLVRDVSQELKPLAEEKGLSLNQDLAGGTEIVVVGDRIELRRVLTNILGNAIKFTDKGSIDVNLKLTPSETASVATIEIKDTGPGIPQEEQAKLFERFRQGKHQRSGSGLGLYLSRCIIEAHQGTVNAMSELGKGSLFTITLPISN